jgi:hypothetical protein
MENEGLAARAKRKSEIWRNRERQLYRERLNGK